MLLPQIVLILGLSIAVLYLCSRLGIPAIVGFLATGILVGPHGLGLVNAIREVEVLAEIGVILLLFAIGIEFSFNQLLQIRRSVLLGGSIQVALTVLAASIAVAQSGRPIGNSIFVGFLLSLSSTAIVLRLLQQKAEVDTPYGRTTLGILIFQDVVIVPMMVLTPLLAGQTGSLGGSLVILIAKGIGIIVLVVLSAKWIVPRILYLIAGTRSRELFLLSVVALCLSVSWLTSLAGLTLSVGAFLAGLIISESEYNHEALGNILPFRDVFSSFFFISIGMLLDLKFLISHYAFIIALAVGALVLKAVMASLAVASLGFSLRVMILVGLALSQIGEFSFILSERGVHYGLISNDGYQLFLAVCILTMAATPFMMALAPRAADALMRLPLPRMLSSGFHPSPETPREEIRDHLIIIGFGVNGRNLARAAKAGAIPYRIVEMNAETVREERATGEPIYFGDATQEVVLEYAGIKHARILIIVINDAAATRRITEIARRLNPKVHIIARTRYVQEVGPLYQLGANEVIPEEFETAVEIFTRLLKKYLVPEVEIEKIVADVRADGYQMFRSSSTKPTSISDVLFHLPDAEVSTFRVARQSPCAGKTLAEIDLRKQHGITVVAIRRGSETIFNPEGDMPLHADDIVIVMGTPEQISEGICLFAGRE